MVTSTTYDGAAPVAAGRRPASIDAGDRGALLALAVRLRSDALDRELVAGTDLLSTGSLRLRARQLVGRRSRRSLSAGLSRTRRAAESASWKLTAAVPPNRAEVLVARPVLAEVERRLRAAGPIHPRGAAMLRRLLCEGAGPLYRPCAAGELTRQLAEISLALEPTAPERLAGAGASPGGDR